MLIQNFMVARINGYTLMEEEALMYQQMCRTLHMQGKLRELLLEREINQLERDQEGAEETNTGFEEH